MSTSKLHSIMTSASSPAFMFLLCLSSFPRFLQNLYYDVEVINHISPFLSSLLLAIAFLCRSGSPKKDRFLCLIEDNFELEDTHDGAILQWAIVMFSHVGHKESGNSVVSFLNQKIQLVISINFIPVVHVFKALKLYCKNALMKCGEKIFNVTDTG